MALKIRLKRMGAKKSPFYRIVVSEAKTPRDGRFVEEIGYYDPIRKDLKVDNESAQKWIKNGAQPTETAKSLLVKSGAIEAPKKVYKQTAAPVKKEPKEAKTAEEKPAKEINPAEEKPAEAAVEDLIEDTAAEVTAEEPEEAVEEEPAKAEQAEAVSEDAATEEPAESTVEEIEEKAEKESVVEEATITK